MKLRTNTKTNAAVLLMAVSGILSAQDDGTELAAAYISGAESGDSLAQYNAAICYERAYGVRLDLKEAIKWLETSASKGNSLAQYRLALYLMNPKSPEQDKERAKDLIRKSAEQGYPQAMCRTGLDLMESGETQKALEMLEKASAKKLAEASFALGRLCETGKYPDKNYSDASSYYNLAAQQGSSEGKARQGLLFWKGGPGLAQDKAKAIEIWKSIASANKTARTCLEMSAAAESSPPAKAAVQPSNPPSLPKPQEEAPQAKKEPEPASPEEEYQKASSYAYGDGVERDMEKAALWWKKAAEGGHVQAQYSLGSYYLKEPGRIPEAVKYLAMAAENGDALAAYQLGKLYQAGTDIEKSQAQATYYFKKGAENGLADSQLAYANCLIAEKNFSEAFAFAKKAAAQGNVKAEYQTAQMLAKGLGTEKAPKAAIEYYEKSASKGYTPALCALGVTLMDMAETEQDREKAFSYFAKAAEQEDARALYYMGICQYKGNGTVKNSDAALLSLKKAVRLGDDQINRPALKVIFEIEQENAKEKKE